VTLSRIAKFHWNFIFNYEGVLTNNELFFIGPFTAHMENISDKRSINITFDISGSFHEKCFEGLYILYYNKVSR